MTLFKRMRTTKVYSITMPPDLARKAERLAKKESRTMSELMRELSPLRSSAELGSSRDG